MRVDIGVPKDAIWRIKSELANAPGKAAKVVAGAINKTAAGTMTETVKAVTREFTVKGKDVRSVLRMSRKATPNSLSAVVTGQYKPLPLTAFKVRPNRRLKKMPKGGLTVTVRRGRSTSIKSGFIANLGGRPRAVKRTGKTRFPVRVLYGPTVARMMSEDEVGEVVMKASAARLAVNIDRQMKRVIV